MGGKFYTIISAFLLVLFVISAASAEIMISQPKAVYNLGDEFEIKLEVDDFQEGYFNVDLVCTGLAEGRQNLYHGILSEKTILISRKLTPVYISGLNGNCYIEAFYGVDQQTSQNFEISKVINVNLDLTELNCKAGSSINVKGKAVKENNGLVAGFIDIRVGNETKAVGEVVQGQFNVNFSIPEKNPAGTETIVVNVYDKDDEGSILNSGEARADLKIIQEPLYIEIAIDKETIFPEEELKIIPFLYDKASYEMPGEEVLLRITNSKGYSVYEKLVKTQEELVFKLESNHAAGNSVITAEKGELIGEKVFNVREYPKIHVEAANGSLIITNTGNVRYYKTIEIDIGGNTIFKKIELDTGERKTYELEAPDGEYNLIIKDDYGVVHEGGVALTGRAVSIREIGGKTYLLAKYPLVWLFIVFVLVFVVLVMYKNNEKRKSYTFPIADVNFKKIPAKGEKKEGKPTEPTEIKRGSIITKGGNIIKPGAITKAEHVLVLNGVKHDAGIIVIKIKNTLSKVAKDTLSKAFEIASELKGVPCQISNDFIIVFSPLVSKSFKNAEWAVEAAQKIDVLLKEHNHKFIDKIVYGIGVNAGEIINKIEKDTLKFTSIGPTINLAKRIADISNGQLLLSKDAHQKTRAEVKVDAAAEESRNNKMELFRVKRIVNNEFAEKFIKDFLRRN